MIRLLSQHGVEPIGRNHLYRPNVPLMLTSATIVFLWGER